MTSDSRQQIAESLEDKPYRDAFVAEFIDTGIAFQILEMREARGWTQKELGRRAGMAQETICLLENPDYGKFTMRTLKRLASAFDVAFTVRFVPFSNLIDWVTDLSPEDVGVVSIDADQRIRDYERCVDAPPANEPG